MPARAYEPAHDGTLGVPPRASHDVELHTTARPKWPDGGEGSTSSVGAIRGAE